jgi:fructose 1,6-bisphosphatase
MNEKAKVLISFIKKQIEDKEKVLKVELYERSKRDLTKRYKIKTAESDLIIEFYENGLIKIKGNGLKKFELKTNKNEPMIIIEQGKEMMTITDENLQKELLEPLKDIKVKQEPSEVFKVLTYE